ncbi:hypothetical protein V502_02917 [Pseudogymnoascus sp. VKM F-4520 (FW-2644)]|nr:hypothetical protein V502_02917 [Pseudogymnoascus sp. VKM F-4520 (FW-2644)]
MKFSLAAAATLLLLPLGTLASPVAAPDNGMPVSTPDELLEARDASPSEIFKRNVTCKITGSSKTVNCRSGPGTGYKVIASVSKGSYYSFGCYKKGSCVNGNCTWDRIFWDGKSCYVSGVYTDSNCSASKLGKC